MKKNKEQQLQKQVDRLERDKFFKIPSTDDGEVMIR